ncbi:MAG TPA: hypothetical protein VHM90_19590 [Phycisphaerae bacterium]|jgi:hypothetical protein|nr:hypothetical protein [Phycisphaerae bacterium]
MRRTISASGILVVAAALCAQTVPAPTKPAVGQPIPHVALLASAQDSIHKTYAAEFTKTTPADRRALAKTLLKDAATSGDDHARRYVLLIDAADVAAAAGDAETAVAAVSALAQTFTVEPLELRRAALMKAHPAASGGDAEAVMRLALETADQAAIVDAFDIVEQMTKLAESAANKTQQVRIVAAIQGRLAALRELTAEFAQVKAAFARLAKNQGDPDAHLVIGSFYALHKGQWALGLPHLAGGSDAGLKSAAEKELAHPTDGLAQAALADAWWEYGEKCTGSTQTVVKAHAAEWYKTARVAIQGVTLARIDARIAGGQLSAASGVAAAPVGVLDLAAAIDPAKDSSQGTWSRGNEGIRCESSAYACLRLSHAVPEEYDLRVAFTRTEGKGAVAVLLAEGKRSFGFALDVSGNARFESVDGKAAKDNPTVVPVAISNGERYELTVEVRKDHVRALLDGKELVTHKTDYKDLSRYSVWKLGDNSVCGIGANNARVTFHAVEMVEVTGKAAR